MDIKDHTIQALTAVVEELPIGTNLALLQFFWMLISGALLPSRGALHPALKAIGLPDEAVRRAWAAFHGGAWSIAFLLHLWQTHIEAKPKWQVHECEGYRAVGVDITPFFRPTLHHVNTQTTRFILPELLNSLLRHPMLDTCRNIMCIHKDACIYKYLVGQGARLSTNPLHLGCQGLDLVEATGNIFAAQFDILRLVPQCLLKDWSSMRIQKSFV